MTTLYVIILLSLIFSAFFSGIEIAFATANKLKIEIDRKNGKLSGRVISRLFRQPGKLISTVLLGNNISLVIYGMGMTPLFNPFLNKYLSAGFASEMLIVTIQTVVSTMIILVVAEFIPKSLFRLNPNRALKNSSIPLLVIYYLLFPLQFIFVKVSEITIRILFRSAKQKEIKELGYADLIHFLHDYSESIGENGQPAHEIRMLQNVIEFRNVKVRECMVPRNEIEAVEINTPIPELKQKFIETTHSKILVFKETIDQMVGYVHPYDLFSSPGSIAAVVKPLLIVPEAMPASDALRLFIQKRKSVALVVDEFGGTKGMLTIEDVIEEITGEIEDEYDEQDALDEIKVTDAEFIFSGRLEIDYLNEKYGFGFPVSDEYETLAGFIIHHQKNIPDPGTLIEIAPYQFTVLKSTGNKIEQLRLVLN